jgi:hypothetical protein
MVEDYHFVFRRVPPDQDWIWERTVVKRSRYSFKDRADAMADAVKHGYILKKTHPA